MEDAAGKGVEGLGTAEGGVDDGEVAGVVAEFQAEGKEGVEGQPEVAGGGGEDGGQGLAVTPEGGVDGGGGGGVGGVVLDGVDEAAVVVVDGVYAPVEEEEGVGVDGEVVYAQLVGGAGLAVVGV